MNILKKIIGAVSKNSQVEHTKIKNIFTKYGIYQAKMYTNNNQEYLAIMSPNFFNLDNPILYIHSDTHQCDPLDEQCGCNNHVDLALTTISREGGLLIYTSKENADIDNLLYKLNTRALESQNTIMFGRNYKSALKGYRGEYIALDFILKDLKLSQVQLITESPNVIYIVEQLGIIISRQSPFISYSYGNSALNNTNETIEQAKAIAFNYGQ